MRKIDTNKLLVESIMNKIKPIIIDAVKESKLYEEDTEETLDFSSLPTFARAYKYTHVETQEQLDDIMKKGTWFVVANDKFLGGWGEAEGTSCKTILVCPKGHAQAEVSAEKMGNDSFNRIRVTPEFPRLSNKSVVVVRHIDECTLWK